MVALGTVSFISRGTTGSQEVGRSLTGGPFLEPARRNVAELERFRGGGAALTRNKMKKTNTNMTELSIKATSQSKLLAGLPSLVGYFCLV